MKLSNILLCTSLTVALFNPTISVKAQPLINEVMSSNTTTIQDEDRDYPDWIEIYNNGATSVELTGHGLSDDPAEPYKWVFPSYVLKSGEYMLVFTSDKNRTLIPNYWETVISLGDKWRYIRGSTNIPENWRLIEFDDSEWQMGPSGIGSRSDYDSTVVQQSTSLFIRKTFTVDDITNITHCLLQIDYDDGFVAYINGHEIARANIGVAGIPPSSSSLASETREMAIYAGGNPEVYKIDTIQSILQQGENVLAIQIHNRSVMYSDISVIPFLTFGMVTPPSDPRGVPDIIKFSTSAYSFHTNFKIKSGGETLFLTDSSGVLCDSLTTGTIAEDISFGRKPDGEPVWVFFSEPTPGKSNSTEGLIGYADSVIVSLPGGFYDSSIALSLTTESTTGVIRYTTDGSIPDETSMLYTSSVSVDTTTVIRASVFEEGYLPGPVMTKSYLIGEESTIPVISLTFNPPDLWDPDIGIYVEGNSDKLGGYPDAPVSPPANWNEDWERPVHIEFFEPDGALGFDIDAGAKIHGKQIRRVPQKSLAIHIREDYGLNELNYPLFPGQAITSFKSFLLRNSGHDWECTMMRDGLIQTLMEPLDIENQVYRPAHIYINGVYWGIQNIREKLNEDYLASYHGIDKDRVDILDDYHATFVGVPYLSAYEGESPDWWTCYIVEGTADHYHELLSYVLEHDLADSASYAHVKTMVDIENFVDYMASRIFMSDPDGPGHNTKFWRPQTPDGRWRWLMYDLDAGFGLTQNPFGVPGPAYLADLLGYYLREEQNPRSPDANFLMYSFVRNEEFLHYFVTRYADLMNTIYTRDVVVQKLVEAKAVLEPEINRHIQRWKYHDSFLNYGPLNSMSDWYDNVATLEEFADLRTGYTRQNLNNNFDLGGEVELTVANNQPGAGYIRLNTITIVEPSFTGIYFREVPVTLTAVPRPGFRFAGWEGAMIAGDETIVLNLEEVTSVTATFVEDVTATNLIMFNEICYNACEASPSADWVELHSTYDVPFDIGGWMFRDDDDSHNYVIPLGTVIEPGYYLILCRDTEAFTAAFPGVDNYVGSFNFGLSSSGDQVRLFDSQGALVDSLTFRCEAPWPEGANGTGPTLELKDPGLDNTLPTSWELSEQYGTPGIANDQVLAVEEELTETSPDVFNLGQNYPNPFNSVTTIPFSVPQSGRVTIEVYVIL